MAYDGPEFPGLGEIDQLLHDLGRSGLRIARTTLGFRTGAAILFSIQSMPNPLDPHLLRLTATPTGIERPSRIGTAPGSSTRWRVSSKIIGTARISFLRDGFCSTIQQIAYRGIRPDISDPLPDNTLIHIGGVVLPGYSTLLESPAAVGESFNAGAPAPFAFPDAAKILAAYTGREPLEISLPVRWRYDHDITKSRTRIGYAPRGDLNVMMESAIRVEAGETVDYTWG